MLNNIESITQHDYLESYFMWKQYVKGNPGLFAGFQYPLTYGKWANLLRSRGHDICPICKSAGSYVFTFSGVDHEYKCLCNVASWTYQQEQMTVKWKNAFEPTAWDKISTTTAFMQTGTQSVDGPKIVAETKKTMESLQRFCAGTMRWHLLRGTFGCGKSTMLKMVGTELFPIATYVTAGNLKNFFREESANGDITELIDAFSKVRILLIDDLGMEYDGSGFTSKTLRNIIDNRMSFPGKFPTIATTNLSLVESDLMNGKNPDDLRAIISRFLDASYSDVHLLTQQDARRISYMNTKNAKVDENGGVQ